MEPAVQPCRVCGVAAHTKKVSKSSGSYTSNWVVCAGCNVQRIYPYPQQGELAAYYNDKYLEKKCTGSVSHLLRFSAEYRPTVFGEYAQSIADMGLTGAMILNSKILDFGCADGIFLDWLRSEGADPARLAGIDISEEMVQLARAKGERAIGKNSAPLQTRLRSIGQGDRQWRDPGAALQKAVRGCAGPGDREHKTFTLSTGTPRISHMRFAVVGVSLDICKRQV